LLEVPVRRIALWAQVRTGVELSRGREVQVLDVAAWNQCRQRLQEEGGQHLQEEGGFPFPGRG
jgi:hypothetical protein